jgi:hypothetical protein
VDRRQRRRWRPVGTSGRSGRDREAGPTGEHAAEVGDRLRAEAALYEPVYSLIVGGADISELVETGEGTAS